jgi:hypothetical protein
MAKDPSPRADALQAMREERYGHLQATAETQPDTERAPKPTGKLIGYAGKDSQGIVPKTDKPPRKRVIRKRKTK